MLEQQTYKVTAGVASPGRENDLKLVISLHDDDDNHSVFYNKGKPQISKGDPCSIKGSAYTTGQTIFVQKRVNEITNIDVSGYGNVDVEIYGSRENLHRNILANEMPEVNLHVTGSHAITLNNVTNFNVNLEVNNRTDIAVRSDVSQMNDLNSHSDLSVGEGLFQTRKNLVVGNTSGAFTGIKKTGTEASILRVYESEMPQNIAIKGTLEVKMCEKNQREGGIDIFHIDGDSIEAYATDNGALPLFTPSLTDDVQNILSSLKGKDRKEATQNLFDTYFLLRNKKAYPGFNAIVARKLLFGLLDDIGVVYDKSHKSRTSTNIKSPVDALKIGCETLLHKLTLEDKASALDAHILESPSATMPSKQDIFTTTMANFTANIMSVVRMAQNAVRPTVR